MKNWTIGKRIIVTSGFLCAVIGFIAGTAIYGVLTIQEISRCVVDTTLPAMTRIAQINSRVGDAIILQYQMALVETPEQRHALSAKVGEVIADNNKTIDEYQTTIDNPTEQKYFDTFAANRTAYVEARKKYIDLLETNPAEARKLLLGDLDQAIKVYTQSATALRDFNADEARTQGADLEKLVKHMILILAVVGIIAIALGAVVSILVVRNVNSALRKISAVLDSNSGQVAAAAGQVSASSQQLAQGASEQAASLEETSSSMEEMTSMVQANSGSVQNSRELANSTRQTTTENVQRVQHLKNAVGEAQASSRHLTEAMEGIKASSNSISKIIKTIDEIAFQTNILALNAAVEAARAGDAGMGFAVVADEVRSLARRSADAAKETAAIIQDSITKSEAGVQINHDVVHKLSDIDEKSQQVDAGLAVILEKVGKVDEAMGQIATASREQSQGIGQVNTALTQMDKVTQSNAASAEETASAAEELNAQAEELSSAVRELLTLVDGTNAGHPAPITARQETVRSVPVKKMSTPTVESALTGARETSPNRATAPVKKSDAIPLESAFHDMN